MNLINQFAHTLGYYCSVNQFVELSLRFLTSQATEQLKSRDSFTKLADSYQIALTSYEPSSVIQQISLSYIVHIHLCFENYLKDICSHARKYGFDDIIEKKKEESWLAYAIRIIITSPQKEITPLIELCEYYRLVRNTAVHDISDGIVKKGAFQRISKYDYKKEAKYARLEAPNEYENIVFDDFVMFARTCNEIANYLYDNLKYDYIKIVNAIDMKQIRKLSGYQNKQERGENALSRYIITNFKYDDTLNTDICDLYRLAVARSSNG